MRRNSKPSEVSLGVASWMIVAAGVYGPLHTYLPHHYAIFQPWAHAGAFLAFFAVCIGVVLALWRLGMDRKTVVYSAIIFQLLFWSGSALTNALGLALGIVAALVLWAVSTAIIYRLRGVAVVSKLFLALAIYLTLLPWVTRVDLGTAPGDPGEVVASEVVYTGGGDRVDVFVVVFDGYPGIQTLETWEGWEGEIVGELSQRGFRVDPAWSAYTSSGLSLSGLFDASYPVTPVGDLASAATPELQLIEGGEGAVFGFMKEAGYDVTYAEAPWWGSQCGDAVDVCVESPVLDYLLFQALKPSFLGLWLERHVGSGLLHGARHTWEWLEENAESIATNGSADFVFAHVVAPHEPLLLDSNCDVRYDERFDRIGITAGSDGAAYGAFIDQAACVDRVMVRIADAIPPDAILIFTADHGSPLLGQGSISPDQWSVAQLRERHSTFFAMRADDRCQPADPVVVQNLLRGVMRCMGASNLPDLDLRLFPSSLFMEDGRLRMISLSDEQTAEVIETDRALGR